MIDYALLADSVDFYSQRGFTRIEVPWTVSEAVNSITKPKWAVSYKLEHNGKCLVGSAEQSFVYMMVKGYLAAGRWQAITPCFRDEFFDETHSKYFMKNELINTMDVSERSVEECCDTALSFFRKHAGKDCEAVKTPEGWDIELNGLELGSYGLRISDTLAWVYATGCAEPRFSTAIRRIMLHSK